MYCKNCGKELKEGQAVCLSCGAKVGTGSSYCYNCGAQIQSGATVCVKCGFAVRESKKEGKKSKITAGLLAILLGLGIHSFYLGNSGKGVAQLLLSCVGIGQIWCLIDGIRIFTGSINTDAEGNPLI